MYQEQRQRRAEMEQEKTGAGLFLMAGSLPRYFLRVWACRKFVNMVDRESQRTQVQILSSLVSYKRGAWW